MQEATDVLNFMKTSPSNSKIFTILCNKIGNEHRKVFTP